MGVIKDVGKDSSSDGKEGTKDGGYDAAIYERYILYEAASLASDLSKGNEIFPFI